MMDDAMYGNNIMAVVDYQLPYSGKGSKISQNAPWPNIRGSNFRHVAIKDKYCAMLK